MGYTAPEHTDTPRPAPQAVTLVSTPRHYAALLIVLLVAGVLVALMPYASGLLGAAVLYVICVHAYDWLTRKTSAGLAAAIVVLGALLLIAVPLTWLVITLVDQTPDALRAIRESPLLPQIERLQLGNVDVGSRLADASGAIVSWLSGQLFTFMGSATSAVLNVTIAFVGLYYMLRGGEGKWAAVRQYIPFSTQTADALRDRFVGVTEATILGTGAVMVSQGVIVGIGLGLVGLPDPLFWGTVAVVAAVVPLVGTTLVWGPAALILLAQHRYGAALAMVVLGGGVAGNIDHLIRPLVYRRISDVHPMITLVGALAGIRYFGILGLLLGPLAIAYVFELLHFYREEYSGAA